MRLRGRRHVCAGVHPLGQKMRPLQARRSTTGPGGLGGGEDLAAPLGECNKRGREKPSASVAPLRPVPRPASGGRPCMEATTARGPRRAARARRRICGNLLWKPRLVDRDLSHLSGTPLRHPAQEATALHASAAGPGFSFNQRSISQVLLTMSLPRMKPPGSSATLAANTGRTVRETSVVATLTPGAWERMHAVTIESKGPAAPTFGTKT